MTFFKTSIETKTSEFLEHIECIFQSDEAFENLYGNYNMLPIAGRF